MVDGVLDVSAGSVGSVAITADIPAVAPIVDAPAIEAPAIEAPIVDAPAVETPSAEPAIVDAPAVEADSILGGEVAPKITVDAPSKAIDAPSKIVSEAAPVVVAPVYEGFKFPENFETNNETVTEFSKLLGELEISAGKIDHAGYEAAGQKLIDLGIKNTQDSIARLNDYYAQFHNNQKKQWLESFKNDPQMGGEKLQETIGSLRSSVEQYAGTPEQLAEFRQIMRDTGVDNHPALTRVIFNMQQKINK